MIPSIVLSLSAVLTIGFPAQPTPSQCVLCPIQLIGIWNGLYYYNCVCCTDLAHGTAISNRTHQLGCQLANPMECIDPIEMTPPMAPESAGDGGTPKAATSSDSLLPVPGKQVAQTAKTTRRGTNRPGHGGKPADPDHPKESTHGTFHTVNGFTVLDDGEVKVLSDTMGEGPRYFRIMVVVQANSLLPVLHIGQEIDAPAETPLIRGFCKGFEHPQTKIRIDMDGRDPNTIPASLEGKDFVVLLEQVSRP